MIGDGDVSKYPSRSPKVLRGGIFKWHLEKMEVRSTWEAYLYTDSLIHRLPSNVLA